MKAWGSTHRGMIRSTNQDVFSADVISEGRTVLLTVCDGMGGANAGHIASKYALEAYVTRVKEAFHEADEAFYIQLCREAVHMANRFVYDIAGREPEFEGMGTTLVSALITEDFCVVLNVGDSRAYAVYADGISQITVDHSLVEEMKQCGKITDAEAENHPQKNYITRVVGVEPRVEADVFVLGREKLKGLILCSDGMSNMVEQKKMLELFNGQGDLQSICEKMIIAANDKGGPDNITVAISKF